MSQPRQLHGPPRPPNARTRTQPSSAVALLIVAGISTLIGLLLAIPALVLGIVAVVYERRSDPRSVTLVRWGWVVYVIGALLMILVGVALVVIAGFIASAG